MPDSNTAGEVMPVFLHYSSLTGFKDIIMHIYHIYKHIKDAKDKVKYCVSGLDALGMEMTDARYH